MRQLAALIGVVLCLTACGTAGEEEAADPGTSDGGAFPVTIDTAYGKVTVEKEPERIVVLNDTYLELMPYADAEPLVSVSDDASIEEYAPWMIEVERGEIDPKLLDGNWAPAPEAIAKWEPDLILTDIWSMDEPLYKTLSQIAPTYVGIETDTQTSWQDHLASIASLTGHDPAVVEEVEADLAADFDAAAESLPGLQGKSFIIPVYKDNQFWPTEYGNDPFISLGLEPSEKQPHGDVTSADVDTISQENIDQLTEDVVVVDASGAVSPKDVERLYADLQEDPRVAAAPASKNGTWIYLTGNQWSAINGGTPLSYRWWLEQILPTLEESALNQSG